MREIKFRAWLTLSDYDDDGNDKDHFGMASKISVHHDGRIGFCLDDGQAIFGGDVFERALDNGTVYEYEGWCYWESMFELMQYTGLKDKNGVEIYEGDIVKVNDEWDGSVYWDEQDCAFWVRTPISVVSVGIYQEVIGNIYENKELLK